MTSNQNMYKKLNDFENTKNKLKDIEDFNSIAAKIDDIMIGDDKLQV